jgi:hypothetical protein
MVSSRGCWICVRPSDIQFTYNFRAEELLTWKMHEREREKFVMQIEKLFFTL